MRVRFAKEIPAFGKLTDSIKRLVKKNGWLPGLDGRRLCVRSEHAALNTLLQSAGAVLMKQALVILNGDATKAGIDFAFVANIHDEFQAEVEPDRAEEFGKMAANAIKKAGEAFNFRVPLAGEYVVGETWADTH